MTWRPKRPCNHLGCNTLTDDGYCEQHKRGTAAQRGYDRQWQVRAKAFKRRNPLCVMCLKEGTIKPAYAVDHIIPHRGNLTLFWNEDNWQSLCRSHHNQKTAQGD